MDATLIKAVGTTHEVLRSVYLDDPSQAYQVPYAEAVTANKKGTATAMTRYLLADTHGNILAGYYAVGLNYTEV